MSDTDRHSIAAMYRRVEAHALLQMALAERFPEDWTRSRIGRWPVTPLVQETPE